MRRLNLTKWKAVFATLDLHGRLSLPNLVLNTRRTFRSDSRLDPKLVKHGLVILIQQHLAFHFTDPRDGITYYETNWQNAYALVRAGKTITILEERFGEGASDLALNLSLQGHVQIKHLEEAYGSSFKKKPASENHVNGNVEGPHMNGHGRANGSNQQGLAVANNSGKLSSIDELHSALNQLRSTGFVVPVGRHTFLSPADVHLEAEAELRRGRYPGGPRGVKGKIDYAADLNKLKRKWADAENETDVHDVSFKASKKQKANGILTNGVNGHYSSGHGAMLDVGLVFL